MENINVIPLEKILTISATEYCIMEGKSLQDYVSKGVRSEDTEKLNVPEGTEVVVAFQRTIFSSLGDIYSFGIGTALIPKKK